MTVDLTMPVLVVDDYPMMQRIFRGLLKQLGFQNVDTAADGAEALDKLRSGNYGMVLSDWHMQPMNGYELLTEVRADRELRSLPFIMVSSETKTEQIVAAKSAGVNSYIIKPFNATTLKNRISSVLGTF